MVIFHSFLYVYQRLKPGCSPGTASDCPRSGSKPTSTTLVSASFSRATVGHAKKRRTSNEDKRKVSTHWLCGLDFLMPPKTWRKHGRPMGNFDMNEWIPGPSHSLNLKCRNETKPWLWNESIHFLAPYLGVSNIEWGQGLVTNHVVGIWDTIRNQCGNMGKYIYIYIL